MAGPIYKLFIAKYTEAWYQLSKEERDQLSAAEREHAKQSGSKIVLVCDCAWSTDQWMFFGVEEYPDIESAQRFGRLKLELPWSRYLEGVSFLGTKWEGE